MEEAPAKGPPSPLSLLLTYMVSGASWVPSYDLRVDTSDKAGAEMSLTYLGLVCNASGEDWLQVMHICLCVCVEIYYLYIYTYIYRYIWNIHLYLYLYIYLYLYLYIYI